MLRIKCIDTQETHVILEGSYPLVSPVDMTIPPMCFGVISHMREIIEYNGIALYLAKNGVFQSHNLIIQTTPVELGLVQTTAFNLSDQPCRIRKGESVSTLMVLRDKA